jgi:ATP-dependent 26S proteasome regulatory subunit
VSYSNLAETILDYAVTEAKRTESEKVSPVHLLAAIRQWNIRKFDEKFPDTTEKIRNALAGIPSQSARPDGPDDAVVKFLDQIDDPDDAWKVVETLLELDAVVNAKPASTQEEAIETSTPRFARRSQPTETVDTSQPEVSLAKISIDTVMVAHITEALQLELSVIEKLVGQDIAFVSSAVLGVYSEKESAELQEATDFSLPTELVAASRSDILNQLGSVGSSDASALAHSYALGLVGVASFAASMDDQVTENEVSVIDQLRVSLREELAKINQTPEIAPKTNFDDLFSDIIGLDSVKKELRQRIDYFTVVQRRKARGLATADHSMHMAFLGNPGTGKTTVARLFAKALHEMNFLESDKIVEVDRSGLIGEYMGHTEKKTNEIVDSALGGVLFIDEAYALVDGYSSQKGYGEEVVDVLVKRMEDNRDRLMVVVAGYAEPMQNFLNSNEGLKSRIPLHLTFPDYSANELVEVAKRFAFKDGFQMDDACVEKIRSIASSIVGSKSFANARDIRNVYERTVRNQFTRIAALGDLATTKEMVTLVDADVAEPNPGEVVKAKQIGFM